MNGVVVEWICERMFVLVCVCVWFHGYVKPSSYCQCLCVCGGGGMCACVNACVCASLLACVHACVHIVIVGVHCSMPHTHWVRKWAITLKGNGAWWWLVQWINWRCMYSKHAFAPEPVEVVINCSNKSIKASFSYSAMFTWSLFSMPGA